MLTSHNVSKSKANEQTYESYVFPNIMASDKPCQQVSLKISAGQFFCTILLTNKQAPMEIITCDT